MSSNPGYHLANIPKGILGEVSKIQEEFAEFVDAHEQQCHIMELLELSDLLGAIEAYISKYNISLDDLIRMKGLTERAFVSGSRV